MLRRAPHLRGSAVRALAALRAAVPVRRPALPPSARSCSVTDGSVAACRRGAGVNTGVTPASSGRLWGCAVPVSPSAPPCWRGSPLSRPPRTTRSSSTTTTPPCIGTRRRARTQVPVAGSGSSSRSATSASFPRAVPPSHWPMPRSSWRRGGQDLRDPGPRVRRGQPEERPSARRGAGGRDRRREERAASRQRGLFRV